MRLEKLSQISEQVPEEKLRVVVLECLQKDRFLCAAPRAGFGGSQRDVLGFVFVLESRNVKRKYNSSYFLVKSELHSTLVRAPFPWSYIPLPVAVEKILRRELWIKHSFF